MKKDPWWEVRISGILTIADGLCLVIFGRYWAWDLKFLTKRAEKNLKHYIEERNATV